MDNKETYKTKDEALAAKEAGKISFMEFIRIADAIDAAAGPVGLWSGHDGPDWDIVQGSHPDAAKEPSDMVQGLGKGVCPRCHTHCDGDCQA